MSNTPKKNKALIGSALTSSAGIFISKLLGVVYVIPFNRLIGEGDMVFYSYAYTFYEYILTLSIAGLPFAISMVVSRYYTKEDYKTVILVRKIATNLLLALGFGAFLLLLFFIPLIATQVAPSAKDIEFINNLKTALYIISTALLVVPLVSCLRGFYQGQKEFVAPALSEVIEQVARVGFLLISTFTCVLVFKQSRVTAVFWAIAAAVFAGLCSLLYLWWFDRKRYRQLKDLASKANYATSTRKGILQELVICGLPFLLASLIGDANGVINGLFFGRAMTAGGYGAEEIKVIFSILNVTAAKLVSIPQVLAIGFGVAIIPMLTSSLIAEDFDLLKKQVNDAFNTATYIAAPLVFCLLYFSNVAYATMFGYENYLLGGEGLRWACLLAITGSIFPLAYSMVMALRLRRVYLYSLAVSFTFKLAITYPCIYYLGYPGAVISSVLSHLLIFLVAMYYITKTYRINLNNYLVNILKITLGIGTMFISAKALEYLGLRFYYQKQINDLIILIIFGSVTCGCYLLTTWIMKLPQSIFDLKIKNRKKGLELE